MSLKMGDTIYIKRFQSEDIDFYCYKHFNDLIGFPTKVFLVRNDTIYVTHPILDVVPLSDNCVDYEVLEDVDLGYHKNLKDTLSLMKTMGASKIPIDKVKKLYKRKIDEQEEPKKSSRDETLLSVINDLNNGDVNAEFLDNFVGGMDNFITLVKKKGWLHLIDPFKPEFEDIQNLLLHAYVQNDPDFVYEIATTLMNGITKIGEDYYYDADYSELADLFKDRDMRPETIENILSGEYDPFEYGSFDTDDEYRDVYDNLDHYAKSVVDEYIVNELKAMGTMSFSPYKRGTDVFIEIAEEQGTENEIKLTDEIITRLMSNNESLEYLINRELDEVRGNLSSIYSSCYGDILSGEWYNDLWGELVGVIVDDKNGEDYSYQKYVWNKDGTRGTKTAYGRRYKVTRCLKEIITGWLNVNQSKNGWNNNTINYFGSYVNLIKDAMEYGPMDWLDVPRLDDYPDWRKMNKCMNDNIESYF